MSFTKVYIHYVWSTKKRFPYLKTPEIRKLVWEHIKTNAKKKNIYIDHVNGYSDHCHCLVSLGKDQTIQKVIQLIKGESAYWINKNNILINLNHPNKFEWQDEYYAVSVSESKINVVRNYIKNQENHHKRRSFQEEYEEIVTKFNFPKP